MQSYEEKGAKGKNVGDANDRAAAGGLYDVVIFTTRPRNTRAFMFIFLHKLKPPEQHEELYIDDRDASFLCILIQGKAENNFGRLDFLLQQRFLGDLPNFIAIHLLFDYIKL